MSTLGAFLVLWGEVAGAKVPWGGRKGEGGKGRDRNGGLTGAVPAGFLLCPATKAALGKSGSGLGDGGHLQR